LARSKISKIFRNAYGWENELERTYSEKEGEKKTDLKLKQLHWLLDRKSPLSLAN
jgi:hypothetical protein